MSPVDILGREPRTGYLAMVLGGLFQDGATPSLRSGREAGASLPGSPAPPVAELSDRRARGNAPGGDLRLEREGLRVYVPLTSMLLLSLLLSLVLALVRR